MLPVLDEGIFLKRNAAVSKPLHHRFHIRDLPSHHRVLSRLEIRSLGDTNRRFTSMHDQRELIIAHKFEAEFPFVEFAGSRGVFGWNKAYEFAGREHRWPPEKSGRNNNTSGS